MAEYVYPAIFHANEDNTFTITYPDLPGCITEMLCIWHNML